MRFESKLPTDVASVLNAAALLDITEFELFRLAWRQWYGDSAPDDALESHFVRYMFDAVVPPWVRHFARRVEEHARAGPLDRTRLGVEPVRRSRRQARNGLRYAISAVLVAVGVVVFAQLGAQYLGIAERCMFPPCY